MELVKAKIGEMKDGKEIDTFPVQFNPTTLRLSLSNLVSDPETTNKATSQQTGTGPTTLSIELVFDTADEGSTGNPVSVRDKTKKIERFFAPQGSGSHPQATPRISFTWGDLNIIGRVDSLTLDLEHFAPNGVPLRAKVSLSIREQDPAKEVQAEKDHRAGSPAPGAAFAGGVGVSVGFGASASIGFSASASVGVAIGGESSAEFAARVGVDPAAWRGLEIGGESSMSLSAGVEVGFNPNLSASAGLGVTIGVEAGSSSSLEESFGLAPKANLTVGGGMGAQLSSGFALSSAGGIGPAIESVQTTRNQMAEQKSRAAFQSPSKALPPSSSSIRQAQSANNSAAAGAASTSQPKRPEQQRTPLSTTGLPSSATERSAPAAPRPPRADKRSSSFGFGVPLRQTFGEAANLRAGLIEGGVALRPRIVGGEPPATNDPTTPAWTALPARDRGRRTADESQGVLRPNRPCGCSGGCKH